MSRPRPGLGSPGFLILCASPSLVTFPDLRGGLGQGYHPGKGLPSFFHGGGGGQELTRGAGVTLPCTVTLPCKPAPDLPCGVGFFRRARHDEPASHSIC